MGPPATSGVASRGFGATAQTVFIFANGCLLELGTEGGVTLGHRNGLVAQDFLQHVKGRRQAQSCAGASWPFRLGKRLACRTRQRRGCTLGAIAASNVAA
jgi:hypothetical protein